MARVLLALCLLSLAVAAQDAPEAGDAAADFGAWRAEARDRETAWREELAIAPGSAADARLSYLIPTLLAEIVGDRDARQMPAVDEVYAALAADAVGIPGADQLGALAEKAGRRVAVQVEARTTGEVGPDATIQLVASIVDREGRRSGTLGPVPEAPGRLADLESHLAALAEAILRHLGPEAKLGVSGFGPGASTEAWLACGDAERLRATGHPEEAVARYRECRQLLPEPARLLVTERLSAALEALVAARIEAGDASSVEADVAEEAAAAQALVAEGGASAAEGHWRLAVAHECLARIGEAQGRPADGRASRLEAAREYVAYAASGQVGGPSGRVRWGRAPKEQGDYRAIAVGGRLLALASPGGLCALDPATGIELWRIEGTPSLRCGPVASDDTVFAVFADRQIVAADAATGRERWYSTADGGPARRLAIGDGAVYCCVWGGTVYSLDAGTGRERWRAEIGDWRPSDVTAANGTVFVAAEGEYVCALDAATGAQLWRSTTVDGWHGGLAAYRGTVYVWSADGYLHALDATSGRERWRFWTGDPVRQAPVIGDGEVFVGTDGGTVCCLDAATGAERWRLYVDGTARSAMALSAGTLYIGSDAGVIHAVDPRSGTELWRLATRRGSIHSLSTDGDRLFVGAIPDLLCVDLGPPRAGPGTRRAQQAASAVLAAGAPADSIALATHAFLDRGELADATRRAIEAGLERLAPLRPLAELAWLKPSVPTQPIGPELWRVDTEGWNWPAPVAVPGGVVVATPGADPCEVRCLDLLSGTERWRLGLGEQSILSLCASGDTVTIATREAGERGQGWLLGVDTASGARRWQAKGAQGFGAPVAFDDALLVATHGDGSAAAVMCLAAETGSERWRVPLRDADAVAIVRSGDSVLAISRDAERGPVDPDSIPSGGRTGHVRAFDAATGTLRWSRRVPGVPLGAPAIAGGTGYFETIAGQIVAIDLGTGRVEWEAGTEVPSARPLVASDGLVFAPGLRAFDGTTGAVRWAAGERAAPIAAQPGVVFASWGEEQNLAALDTATGAVKWLFEPGEPAGIVVPVVDGPLLVGTASGILHALDAATGTPLWHMPLGWQGLNLLVAGDTVVASTSSGRVCAISLAKAEQLVAQGRRWWGPFMCAPAGGPLHGWTAYVEHLTDPTRLRADDRVPVWCRNAEAAGLSATYAEAVGRLCGMVNGRQFETPQRIGEELGYSADELAEILTTICSPHTTTRPGIRWSWWHEASIDLDESLSAVWPDDPAKQAVAQALAAHAEKARPGKPEQTACHRWLLDRGATEAEIAKACGRLARAEPPGLAGFTDEETWE